MFHVHSDFLFDCYMRYTNTLMYVCMYVAWIVNNFQHTAPHPFLTIQPYPESIRHVAHSVCT